MSKPPKTVEKHRDTLLEFAERVERLPIAIVVGADMLRRELDPVSEAARGLGLERLRNEVHDVAALLRRAITARPEHEQRLLNAMDAAAKKAELPRLAWVRTVIARELENEGF